MAVVVEPAVVGHAGVERVLAGVAERGVAEIVAERDRLGEVVVEPERAGERAGDLRDLDRMGEAGAEMVALVMDEHLGLVGEAAEGGRMDDAVPVALELGSGRRRRLGNEAPGRARRIGRIGRPASPPRFVRPFRSPVLRALARRPYLSGQSLEGAPKGDRDGRSFVHERRRPDRRRRLDQRQRRQAPERDSQGRAGRGPAHLGQGRRLLGLPVRLRRRPEPAPRTISSPPATGRRSSSIRSRSRC